MMITIMAPVITAEVPGKRMETAMPVQQLAKTHMEILVGTARDLVRSKSPASSATGKVR
jgi:hypothetical protein